MKTVKRTISAILSVCFVLSITMIFSSAADHVRTTPLDLSSATADIGDLELDGYHWDNANSTLTIKDLTITLDNVTAGGTNAIKLPDKDCRIIIEGTNKISLTDKATAKGISTAGIFCLGSNIDISGTGSLDLEYTGNTSDEYGKFYGIACNASLTLTGVKITAAATVNVHTTAVLLRSHDDITIKDSAVDSVNFVTAVSNYGSCIVTDSTVSGNNTQNILTTVGALNARKDVIIKNSTVYLKTGCMAGIMSKGGIVDIDSSDVTAINTLSDTDEILEGAGIMGASSDISITDSTVRASGSNYGIVSIGFTNKNSSTATKTGSISVSGSEVTASSSDSGLAGILTLFVYEDGDLDDTSDTKAASIRASVPLNINDEIVIQGNALRPDKTYISRGEFDATYTGPDKDNKLIMIDTFSPDITKALSFTYDRANDKYLLSNASHTVVLTTAISSKTVLNGGKLREGTVLKADDDILAALGNPSKDNNTFAGWFYDPEFTKPVQPGDKYVKGMVLYAKWTVNTSANTVNTGDNTAIGAAAAMKFASISGLLFIKKRKTE